MREISIAFQLDEDCLQQKSFSVACGQALVSPIAFSTSLLAEAIGPKDMDANNYIAHGIWESFSKSKVLENRPPVY